jgi:hypothetical protein
VEGGGWAQLLGSGWGRQPGRQGCDSGRRRKGILLVPVQGAGDAASAVPGAAAAPAHLEGLLRVVEAAARHAVPDQVGPARVDLQAARVADDDHGGARAREAHVDAPLVRHEADRLARAPASGEGGAGGAAGR